MSEIELIDVVALILIKDDKILIAQRSSTDHLALKWEFPGGKIEVGETAESALVREIREELNLEIAVTAHFLTSIYDQLPKPLRLHAYEAKLLEGHPKNLIHNEVLWVPINQLTKYDFAPADLPFVKKLMDRQKEKDYTCKLSIEHTY